MDKVKAMPYDVLFFLFILFLLFNLGYHIGKPRQYDQAVTGYATVIAEKEVGDAADEAVLFVDGSLPVTVLSGENGIYFIEMTGKATEAGFLLGGTKYLSENQPIFIYGERSGIEGRISELSVVSSDGR